MHYVNRWTGGYQLRDIVRYLDGVLLLCYGKPQETKMSIDDTRRQIGAPLPIVAGFHAYPPVTPDAVTLVEQMRTARRLGVRDMNFYNYGIMPRRNLKWIKKTIVG
jgi:hypothetical protein